MGQQGGEKNRVEVSRCADLSRRADHIIPIDFLSILAISKEGVGRYRAEMGFQSFQGHDGVEVS